MTKRNIFILGFPRSGTHWLFHHLHLRTSFEAFNEKFSSERKVSFKEPKTLVDSSLENARQLYKQGGIIDASQIYFHQPKNIKPYLNKDDVFIFIVRDRASSILSLMNLKHSGQENLHSELEAFGLPNWLMRDIIFSDNEIVDNIRRDFRRNSLVSPIVRNANELVAQEIKYFLKFNEFPWHSYLLTYMHGYHIQNFKCNSNTQNLCIIKFEELINDPYAILKKLMVRFDIQINLEPNFDLGAEKQWQSQKKIFSLNLASHKILQKFYQDDDNLLESFRSYFL